MCQCRWINVSKEQTNRMYIAKVKGKDVITLYVYGAVQVVTETYNWTMKSVAA
jgi:hypothetical protein